jgi:hypothetical protein
MAFRRSGLFASPFGERNGAHNASWIEQNGAVLCLRKLREKALQFIKTFAGLPQLGP